ncbi:MAG: PQQ-binding-like beta-propeller repeat protein, partial [Anaerolineae bacterium]|nr:PQQ-binding-like beta-propeller repeat protein [Anaerolineae bacterium]
GKEIWKSTQEHPLLGIYKYPAIASTPLVLDDRIVLREVNSHGGNEGQAKNLVYLDKATGKMLDRKYAGHVDYRTQYASVATNGNYMLYPFGVHDIYGSPAICQNFNRLICADLDNNAWLWDFNVGDIDALAEPVGTQDMAIVGTMEGYLYALKLDSADSCDRIAWAFKASGAVNTQVALENGRVFFGCNGGSVYCLDEKAGTLLWERRVDPVEHRARKHFSTPLVHGHKVYIGAANCRVYALDAETGAVVWETETSDWVRARPAASGESILVATVDGKLHCVDSAGRLSWSKAISTHPIYADIVRDDDIARAKDHLLISDSNLMLYCLSADGQILWEKSTLNAFVDSTGQRIFTDELSGGTYYQSKPTAYRGKIFFGAPSGFLCAANAETGEEVWKFEMGAAISVGPACADGRVFAGQQGGERFFYCIDTENGSLIWKQTLPGGWVWGSATVHEGLVYVPTVSGYAVCLDAKTGHIVWMFPTAKSIPAEPAIDGDLVYFGSWSGSIYAFHKKTGEVVWKANGTRLDSGTLIAFDGKVYLPHHNNILKSLDGKTGDILNEGNTNDEEKGAFSDFNATPAFHGGRAFFSARGGIGLHGVPLFSTVYCVDPETSKIYWTYPDGGGLSAPAVASGRVYIGSGNSPFFYCLDKETGKPLWIYKLGHRVEESTLCIYRDKVFVLAADGYVHAIE